MSIINAEEQSHTSLPGDLYDVQMEVAGGLFGGCVWIPVVF